MALLMYKWLLLMATFFNVPSKPLHEPIVVHPFYVSVTEINHNASDKTLEVASKIFTEDLETALNKAYKTKVDLYTEKGHALAEKYINDYLGRHLLIKTDGKPAKLEILGFEREGEATWCYLEVKNIPQVKRVDIQNSILYDSFTDQINLMHVTIKGVRKSGKVVYPEIGFAAEF